MEMEMDSETTLRLFEEGATLVFLDVPTGTEVGIDMNIWITGEKFKGIKMIPPGIHFIHFSTVSRDGLSQSPRIGFFHHFQRKELLLKKYDKVAEDLSTAEPPKEDITLINANLWDLDKCLGPYPYDNWRKWVSLSSKLNDQTIERVSPPSGRICSAPELFLEKDQSTQPPEPSTSKRLTKLEYAESLLPKMYESLESKIRFTDIPKHSYDRRQTSPSDITKHNLDWTPKLELVIQAAGGTDPNQLLAELEFSFICFLVGQSYSSFEHWKDLVQLICFSDAALSKYTNFYMDFLIDLYFQLEHVSTDLFTDIVTQNNFIYVCLNKLFENIRDCESAESRLKGKAERFATFLLGKYGWAFACFEKQEQNSLGIDEDDEYQPVVVDLETGNY